MPLYAYRCTQCGHKFEKIQNFSAKQETECPKCHGVLERPLTAPALNFKGAGWYVNDYAKNGGPSKESGSKEGKEGKESKEKSGSEAKSESSSESKQSESSTKTETSKPATPVPATSSDK